MAIIDVAEVGNTVLIWIHVLWEVDDDGKPDRLIGYFDDGTTAHSAGQELNSRKADGEKAELLMERILAVVRNGLVFPVAIAPVEIKAQKSLVVDGQDLAEAILVRTLDYTQTQALAALPSDRLREIIDKTNHQRMHNRQMYTAVFTKDSE